jgi:hypothetical protein
MNSIIMNLSLFVYGKSTMKALYSIAFFSLILGASPAFSLSWSEYVKKQPIIPNQHSTPLDDMSDFEKTLLLSAHSNNIPAQAALGEAYYFAREGVKKDLSKSYFWFKKAAENGSIESLNNLGFLLKNGFGCEKDLKKAYDYFSKVVQTNLSPIAYFNLSAMIYGGKGTNKNEGEAYQVFAKAFNAFPRLQLLFRILYTLKEKENVLPIFLQENNNVFHKLESSETISASFNVFKFFLDAGEDIENELLQLIADYGFSLSPTTTIAELASFLMRSVLLLEKIQSRGHLAPSMPSPKALLP